MPDLTAISGIWLLKLIQFRLSAMKNGKLKKKVCTYHGKHFQPFLISHFFPIVISSKNEQTLIKYSFAKFQDISPEEDL